MLYGAAVLVVLMLAIVAIGYLLPVGHVASVGAHIDRPPSEVFDAISDVARYAEWRPGVSSVEVTAAAPATRWKERGSNGDITFEIEQREAPRQLRTRIADRSLPFGGTWTYELTPSGSGTYLRITERGEVYNPVFRVLSRFVFGHTTTMDAYLEALAKRLGEKTT